MEINRKLPRNTEAERAVLAAMLTTSEAITKVQSILNDDDFFLEEHKILYRAINELYKKKKNVDTVTLCDYLEKNKQLEKIGGTIFIMGLGDVISTTANVVHHANIVKEKSTLRKLINAGESIVGEAYDDAEELDTIMDNAEQKIFSITSRQTTGEFEHINPIINRVFSKINHLYENPNNYLGIETKFTELDKATSGLQNSDLILLAARPSMGKTAFALNIATNVSMGIGSNEPRPVAIFSLEMSKEQLAQRVLSTYSGIDAQMLKTGRLNREEWNSLPKIVNEISHAKLYIDDTPGLNAMELRSRARHLQSTYGLDLLIIDYLQLMQGRKTKSGEANRQQEISEISRSLKALARELNVPVIALSQLSRAVEMRAEKRPQLSDLRESGSLEQDADIVMFLYREDYYNSNTENKNLCELIIAKHRNGPTQTISLHFNKNLIRFGNFASSQGDDVPPEE